MKTHPLHEKALKLSTQYLLLESELIDLLQQIEREKIHFQLGYRSLFQYCTEALKLDENQAYLETCKTHTGSAEFARKTNHLDLQAKSTNRLPPAERAFRLARRPGGQEASPRCHKESKATTYQKS